MGESQRERLLEDLGRVLLDPASSESERESAKRALRRLGDEDSMRRLAKDAIEADSTSAIMEVLDVLGMRRQLGLAELELVGLLYDAATEVRLRTMELIDNKGDQRLKSLLEQFIAAAEEPGSILGPTDIAMAQRTLQSLEKRGA